MHGSDEERRRQGQTPATLPALDRLHGAPRRVTASGFTDLRSTRRTGRVVQLPLRVHPRVKAVVDALLERDGHPSMVALIEAAIDAYQQVHGVIDPELLPSEEELVRRIERERHLRDGR